LETEGQPSVDHVLGCLDFWEAEDFLQKLRAAIALSVRLR
jgi:hypothetical protein